MKKFAFMFVILAVTVTLAFAETKVSGTIGQNTTWTKAGSPYIVTGDINISKSLSAAAVLTIEPGVTVRFDPGTKIEVGNVYQGAVKAAGTKELPVTFTSNTDSPASGDWQGIIFKGATVDTMTVLEYCTVEYGGAELGANISCYSSSPTVRNSVIRYSSGKGIYADNESFPVISGNTISDNASYPLHLNPVAVKNITGNICSDNGKQSILISGGNINTDTLWKNEGGISDYIVTGDINISKSLSAAAVLTIEPGVTVRFDPGTKIEVGNVYQGAVKAAGTKELPVTFTSNTDSPASGDWKGIIFKGATVDTMTVLEYCTVEYGGAELGTNIICYDSKPAIRYSTVRYSSETGIKASSGAGPVITCNNIEDNLYGIYIEGEAQPVIHENNFLRNKTYGIYWENGYSSEKPTAVDASNNFWNDAGGPNKSGDKAGGDTTYAVTLTPYLTAKKECAAPVKSA